MEYKEFDKRYNTRDEDDVILTSCIINEDGEILFRDNIDTVDRWYSDNDVEYKWENNKFLGAYYNGKRVITSNLGGVVFHFMHNDWLLKGK